MRITKTYICRNCKKESQPHDYEIETDNCRCPHCGGMCDPNKREQRRLMRARHAGSQRFSNDNFERKQQT